MALSVVNHICKLSHTLQLETETEMELAAKWRAKLKEELPPSPSLAVAEANKVSTKCGQEMAQRQHINLCQLATQDTCGRTRRGKTKRRCGNTGKAVKADVDRHK